MADSLSAPTTLDRRSERIRATAGRSAGLAVLLLACVVFFSASSPYFATTSNAFTLFRIASEAGLIAIGMSLVIASGGIDLSVGAIFSLSSVTLGVLFSHGVPISRCVAVAALVGLGCGLLNGLIVVVLRIHPLLVTLGTLALFRGLALGISNGSGIAGFPTSFEVVGQGYVSIVPAQCLLWLAVIAVAVFVTTRTAAGRSLVAVGANETAARFSGVRVALARLTVYGVAGLLSGIAAVIYTSRVLSSRADAGNGLELLAIAAVVVGGASIQGGQISIVRTTLAVIAIATIPNGFVLSGYSTSWQYVAIGLVMIVAVVFNEGLATRVFNFVARRRAAPPEPSRDRLEKEEAHVEHG
ncbi:MAG: ABC transporter permease [Nocardioides sp.]|uniref:ABC transporter permease n=1 Tax=Nocardioides sp. TaxID=35761 RepID=UPI0039E6BEEE